MKKTVTKANLIVRYEVLGDAGKNQTKSLNFVGLNAEAEPGDIYLAAEKLASLTPYKLKEACMVETSILGVVETKLNPKDRGRIFAA